MPKLVWDAIGEKLYETGTKKGVLYPMENGEYTTGVVWNGLTSVNESPSGADENAFYADDIKYGGIRAAEEFGATVEAYTYPDEFAVCDGSAQPVPGVTIGQQTRKPFGLSFVSTVGNDTDGLDHGYKIHLIYNATASPSERGYQTINDSPDAISFSWELTTTPVNVTGYKPTANIIIDSTKFTTEQQKAKLAAFEDILYGTDAVEANAQEGIEAHEATTARLPLPDEVFRLLTVSGG